MTRQVADIHVFDEDDRIIVAAESSGPSARLELTDADALALADELTIRVELRRKAAA